MMIKKYFLISLAVICSFGPLSAMEPEQCAMHVSVPLQRSYRPLFASFWDKTLFKLLPAELRRELEKFTDMKIRFSTPCNFWALQDQMCHGGFVTEMLPGIVYATDEEGRYICIAKNNYRTLKLYDSAKHQVLWSQSFRSIKSVQFSTDEQYLLVYDYQRTSYLIDTQSGSYVWPGNSHIGYIMDLFATKEKKILYAIVEDNVNSIDIIELLIFELIDNQYVLKEQVNLQQLLSTDKKIILAFFVDHGTKLIIQLSDGSLEIIDVAIKQVIRCFSVPDNPDSASLTKIIRAKNYSQWIICDNKLETFLFDLLNRKKISQFKCFYNMLSMSGFDRSFFYDSQHFRVADPRGLIDAASGQRLISCIGKTGMVICNSHGTYLFTRRLRMQICNPEIQHFLDTCTYEQRLLLEAAYKAALEKNGWGASAWRAVCKYLPLSEVAPGSSVFENQFWIEILNSLPQRLQETIKLVLSQGALRAQVSLN